MGRVLALPQKPNLGEIQTWDHPDAGTLLNVAGIVEMCRTSSSEPLRKAYREFLRVWNRMSSTEGSDLDKQFQALKEAFATIGMHIGDSWQRSDIQQQVRFAASGAGGFAQGR